jgi:hypothetical protein
MTMLRLDFWGSLVDLIGLVILLSYDVWFLQPILMRWPSLARRRALLLKLKAQSMPTDDMSEQFRTFLVETLTGRDVALFMRLYPDRGQLQKPTSVEVFTRFGNRIRNPEPWIYPSAGGENSSLATPLILTALFTNEENDIRKIVYAVGFVGMLIGSVMFLIHAAFRW